METAKVKKINYAYLLGYVFGPAAVMALSILIGWRYFFYCGTGAVVCFAVVPLLAVLWWASAGRNIFKLGKKRMVRQLDEMGIDRRQIFYSDNCVVSMDAEQGKLGLLFFWNPFKVQILPASGVTRAWADDGAMGIGFTRGTSRVSFLFQVGRTKVRVNTFISNGRWKMNDERVLEGISKADLWVQVLDQARRQEAGV